MRPWLTDDIKSYNDNKELYKEVLKMPFEEDFLWHANKEKQAILTVEPTEVPTITVGEVLKTRNLTPDEEFSVIYSATLMYYIAKLRYEFRDMDMCLFESNIFPAYQEEIIKKSSDASVNITRLHRYEYKIVMPKIIYNNNNEIGNLIVNVSFLYEDLMKTPLINPKTGKTFTGIDNLKYPGLPEEVKKRIIKDMFQCELFNYVLACDLDNQTANNMWNTYNWDVIVNTIYKMYLKEIETSKSNT